VRAAVKRLAARAEDKGVSESDDRPDDRQFERSPAKLEVEIASELGARVEGVIRDVSMAGLFVVCRERLPVGSLCELVVRVPSAADEGPIEAHGRVAHVEPDGMGVESTDLALAHYEKLRRLSGDDAPSDD